ncbi:MAG: hypothetical protein K6G90_09685 [Clostridia bacterium]|nr:hypothetical protein [Clostridia bacterium]
MKKIKKSFSLLFAILMLAVFFAQAAPVRAETAADADTKWNEIKAKIWDLIYTDVKKVDLSDCKIKVGTDDYDRLHYCIYYTPQHLWPDVRIIRNPKTGLVLRAEFDGDAAEMNKKYKACLAAIDELMGDIKSDKTLSKADKLLLLHDRLAIRSEYDRAASKNRENASGDSFSAYGPLVRRKGVCNGYTLAYGWMLDILGVENRYIESEKLDHSWNMVWLDGQSYFTDVTHDDPTPDTPGRVYHRNFMVSYAKFSANHPGAADYTAAPASTLYENYFCTDTAREILYINGAFWYLKVKDSTKRLIKRMPSGKETVIKDFSSLWQDIVSGERAVPYVGKILADGDCVLYTDPKAVYSYNTVTGADMPAYTPVKIVTGSDRCIAGLRQTDGRVYVSGNTLNCDYYGSAPADADTESFVFCDHGGAALLERLKGADCRTAGAAIYKCPSCGYEYFAEGKGVYGDHDFIVRKVTEAALKSAATCVSPAEYYYTCSVCGAVEKNAAHTFTDGEAAGHKWTWVVEQPPTCRSYGVWYKECAVCRIKE